MTSIFTKIINREISAHIIYEDDDVIAFLDINPVRKGHVLLVPKDESRRLHDVEPALAAMLMITSQELMLHLKSILKCDYIQLMVEGIEVAHTHIHLIPRSLEDSLQKWTHESYADGEIETYENNLKIS